MEAGCSLRQAAAIFPRAALRVLVTPPVRRKVLVVGGGGREHALATRLASSPSVREVILAPGNGGTAGAFRNFPIRADEIADIAMMAEREGVDFVVVGPEAPLVLGLVDELDARNIPCFGPSKEAAQLEGSKAFMKDFAARHRIPTAGFQVFEDAKLAAAYIRERGRPVVVKADGLCAGKGVIVAKDAEEAIRAAEEMLSGEAFGEAGRRIIVEDFIEGEEVSVHAICDGERFFLLPAVQDHKRIGEGDTGPNTGGMGAYGPAPVVDSAMERRVAEEIILPTLRGMKADGIPFRGALFAGLMITNHGEPLLLEFNVRFGDPETEVLVELIDGDFGELLYSAATGKLDEAQASLADRYAMAVVLASENYPDTPRTGDVISGLESAAKLGDTRIFHAGTKQEGADIVTSGGRVLVVTGVGDSLEGARDRAYEGAEMVHFRGMQMRRDIGYRALGGD